MSAHRRTRTRSDSRTRWPHAPLVSFALVLTAAAGYIALAANEATGPSDAVEPTDGRWQMLPEAAEARERGLSSLGAARVGGRVVIVGQSSYAQDRVEALAYDLGRRSWNWAPRSPLRWRTAGSVVGTGREAIVWGGTTAAGADGKPLFDPDGAAYDPQRRAWRAIADAPIARRAFHTAVWTGDRMIVWGGWASGTRARLGKAGRLRGDGAAYDPARDRWTRIAPAPLRPRRGQVAVWTGRRMIVWGGEIEPARDGDPRHKGSSSKTTDGAIYDPRRDRWKTIRRAPARSMPQMQAVWAGDRMVVAGTEGGPIAYRPSNDRWERLPRLPWGRARAGSTLTWSGEEVVIWGGVRGPCGDCYLRRAGRGSSRTDGLAHGGRGWRLLPPSPLAPRDRHAAVGLGGGRFLVWGGCCAGSRQRASGAIYRPGPLIPPDVSKDLSKPCRSIVASVTVRCPAWLPAPPSRDGRESYHVSKADFDGDACSYLTELHAGTDLSGRIANPHHVWIGGHCRPLPLSGTGGRWPPSPVAEHYFALLSPAPEAPGQRGPSPLVHPRVVGVTSVRGSRALVLAVEPYPRGGIHGGHYVVVWNEGDEGYAISLHYPRGDKGKPPLLAHVRALTRAAASMRSVGG